MTQIFKYELYDIATNNRPSLTSFDDSQEVNDGSWSGTKTYQEAQDLMSNKVRWTEGEQMVEKVRAKFPHLFEPQGDGTDIAFVHDVAGCEVDIGRYLDGEPECMIDYHLTEAERKGKLIDLYWCPSVSAGVRANQMMDYGVAMYCIIDTLEARGYAVNLYACYLNKSYDSNHCVRIKKSSEINQLTTMLYAIAHPSMFRRHIFKAWESDLNKLDWGYGEVTQANEFSNEDAMPYFKENPTRSFFIKGLQQYGIGLTSEQYFTKMSEDINKMVEQIDEDGAIRLPSDKVDFNFTR